MLNEDYLIISWYLHVWNRVEVAKNLPTCPAEKRSLGENLVTDVQMPCSTQERLCTEGGRGLNFLCFENFDLGLADEPNICSHCYSMPYMKIPANNQVIIMGMQIDIWIHLIVESCIFFPVASVVCCLKGAVRFGTFKSIDFKKNWYVKVPVVPRSLML